MGSWTETHGGLSLRAMITMLNSMAARDFATALDRHVEWGLHYLDLKDAIFGKGILDLTDAEACRAAEMIAERGLSVYCLSTTLFHDEVESGEEEFRRNNLEPLDRSIAIARVLQPDLIRLLSARTIRRDEFLHSTGYLQSEHPWLIELYREAIENITEAGFRATIENESHDNIFSNPNEILGFYDALDCGDRVSLTWDVQNLWQMGTYLSLDVYQQLKPLITYYHLKGGQSEEGSRSFRSPAGDPGAPGLEPSEVVPACRDRSRWFGRGRNPRHRGPPAQFPAGGITAPGSSLGYERANVLGHSPYPRLRLLQPFPVLCPAVGLLVRIPLGQVPFLQRLRQQCRSTPFVRRLLRYYGPVRLPGTVHHRITPWIRGADNAALRCRSSALPIPAQ